MSHVTGKQKVEIVDFKVAGIGAFPFDMLRFDCAWPKHEAQVRHLTSNERREIDLQCVGHPTPERWESFGWKVTSQL